jgi:hypothetical protein
MSHLSLLDLLCLAPLMTIASGFPKEEVAHLYLHAKKAFSLNLFLSFPAMSSRPSTPPSDDDDFRSLRNAMAQESPTAPQVFSTAKRSHGAMAGDGDSPSDNEEDPGAAPTLPLVNQNILAAIRLFAGKKRLRVDQITELETFVKVSRSSLAAGVRSS